MKKTNSNVKKTTKKVNNKQKFRRICFTLNNYNNEEYQSFIDEYNNNNNIQYMIIGKEVGENKTPHLQGYIEFKNQMYFNNIKKINNRMHFEASKGNQQQNINYCSKDNDFTEFGERKKQGKRNDLVKIKEMIKDNKPMKEILNECTNYQQMCCAQKLMSYKPLNIKERNIPEVIYIHGKSGSGKTEYARNICNENSTYTFERKMDWFDGYDYDEDVIINDFRSSKCEYSFLLNLLDGYEMRVPIKGGFTIWKPKRVIFTSVIHPKKLYRNISEEEDSIDQLLRRITKYIVMKPGFKPVISKL